MRFRLDLKLGILFFLCSLLLIGLPELEAAAGSENLVSRIQLTVIGTVVNSQNIPIEDAAVSVSVNQETQAIVVGEEEQERVFTGKNGRFITQLTLTTDPSYLSDLSITVSKSGYKTRHIRIHAEHLFCKINDCFARVGFLTLQRVLNQAFYLSTAIFVVIFGMISFNVLHETIAAFLGAASMLGISYFVGSFYPNFWIIGFHKAVEYIDFDVIFLLLGMMIFMAIMSQTGVFQWLAFQTFKLGKGSSFIVAIILILITGVISSVLNDTTVMLLMTISDQKQSLFQKYWPPT
jgi:hypothetical protein